MKMGMGYGHPDKPEDYVPVVRVVNQGDISRMNARTNELLNELIALHKQEPWWRRGLRRLGKKSAPPMTLDEMFCKCEQFKPVEPLSHSR